MSVLALLCLLEIYGLQFSQKDFVFVKSVVKIVRLTPRLS